MADETNHQESHEDGEDEDRDESGCMAALRGKTYGDAGQPTRWNGHGQREEQNKRRGEEEEKPLHVGRLRWGAAADAEVWSESAPIRSALAGMRLRLCRTLALDVRLLAAGVLGNDG